MGSNSEMLIKLSDEFTDSLWRQMRAGVSQFDEDSVLAFEFEEDRARIWRLLWGVAAAGMAEIVGEAGGDTAKVDEHIAMLVASGREDEIIYDATRLARGRDHARDWFSTVPPGAGIEVPPLFPKKLSFRIKRRVDEWDEYLCSGPSLRDAFELLCEQLGHTYGDETMGTEADWTVEEIPSRPMAECIRAWEEHKDRMAAIPSGHCPE